MELGIPYELWDKPPVEVTNMKSQCEDLVEKYEDSIENWYFKHQDSKPLIKYLCEERALKNQDSKCLYEIMDESKKEGSGDEGGSQEKKAKNKGEKKSGGSAKNADSKEKPGKLKGEVGDEDSQQQTKTDKDEL